MLEANNIETLLEVLNSTEPITFQGDTVEPAMMPVGKLSNIYLRKGRMYAISEINNRMFLLWHIENGGDLTNQICVTLPKAYLSELVAVLKGEW